MGRRTSVCLMLGLLTAMAAAKADPIKTSGGLVSGVAVPTAPYALTRASRSRSLR